MSMDAGDFYSFIKRRRSTRVFKETPVPREVLERVISAAVEAPTACNRQLWHFVIVTDDEMKEKVSRLSDAQQSYLYDAPAILCCFYDCTLENRNPCKTPFIGAGMALYSVLLACEAEGLGAIYLGGIRRPSGVEKAVGAPPWATNLGLICVGYRADEPPAPPHRKAQDIISWNTFDLPQKHYHADIRPHLWKLSQTADFRDKLTWYKGIGIDGKTLHVDPDERFSDKFRYMTGRLGMLIGKYEQPRVLDIFSLNGDMVYQLLNAAENDLEKLYAYDLTPGILEYMKVRFSHKRETEKLEVLLNEEPEQVRIPLPDRHVQVISCYERVEQFEDPTPLLREMHRVLEPGGRALVVVSNRFYPHMYRYKRMRKQNYALGRNWNRGPERKWEHGQMMDFFAKAGFRVEEMTGLQPIEMKLTQVGERLARRFGRHDWGDRLADLRSQLYTTKSFTRFTSMSMAYELTRD